MGLTDALRRVFSAEKSRVRTIETWKDEKPTYSGVNFRNMVLEGWRKNELIFACISKMANTASQISMQVVGRGTKDYEEEHPFRNLLQKPNPHFSEFDFWVSVIVYTRLAGKAVYEKEYNNGGQVIRIWPLRPDWVHPIPSSRSYLKGFSYEVPGLEPEILPPEKVIWFNVFDPLNQYHGFPPAAVAGRVGDVDNSATDYLKLFMEKGGTPPGLLRTKRKLQDAQVEDIRRRWRERYGGMGHWIDPAVLDMEAEYQKIGLSFQEMGFEVLDARSEARICQVLQVPPILVGAKVGLDRSTFSNYREARLAWWQDDLLPLYASFLDVMQNSFAQDFPDAELVYDLSRVPALQEEQNSRWQRALEALRGGGITVNEYREEIGKKTKGKAGEVYLRPVGTVEVPAKIGVRKPEPVALPEASEGEGTEEPETAEEEEEEEEETEKPGTAPKQRKALGVAPDDAHRTSLETRIAAELLGYFENLERQIVKELEEDHGA